MSQSKQFNHPFTFTVVNFGVDRILILMGQNKVPQAVEELYWFILYLDEKIQETLKDDIETLNSMSLRQIPMNRDKVSEIVKKVANEMHRAGYFLGAKMRPPTRESGLKDIQLTVDRARYAKDQEVPR